MLCSNKVPSISVTLDEENIQNGAMQILKVVRPEWILNNSVKIQSKVFTDGLSNKLVGFFTENKPEEIVIVKVFGTNSDMMIDRKAEVETMRLLHERKCGAEVYATFENGICYEFLNGSTLEVSDCLDDQIYPLVAAQLAHIHSRLNSPNTNGHQNNNRPKLRSALWDKMRQFNKLVEEIMTTDPKLCLRLAGEGLRPGWAAGAIDELEGILEKRGMPVTLCHNDIQPRNIIYDKKDGRVTFIDVEFAMLNYSPFDVANHFMEFAGVSEVDYSKVPDKSFREKWISEYLKHLKNEEDADFSVQEFYCWVEACIPASHLLWVLWATCQAHYSTINFDYVKYVGLRFTEYNKCMEILRKENH